MGNSANTHHITQPAMLPSRGPGQATGVKRPVPVAVIYDLNRLAVPKIENPQTSEQPPARGGALFFARMSRSIKDDPFLKRLSRLK